MNCLLCNRQINPRLTFTQLFLLQTPEETLCERCAATFEKIPEQHCPRCYKPDTADICPDCQKWEEQGIIINHTAIFKYNAAMHDFFSQYKFIGDYRLHKVFMPYFKKFDRSYTVVPVPVSADRLQERGFNQVTAFLSATKFTDILVKADTIKQSSLSRQDRLTSKNAFSLKPNAQIPDKILLVDDIYTTGATLQHAVSTLKSAGATDIKTFSLCR